VDAEAKAFVPPSTANKPGAVEYGFWCFVIIAVGRLGELVPGLSGLPVAKVAIGLALVSLAASWKRMPGLAPGAKPLASTAKWLFALAVVLTPFSIWPGASLQFLVSELPVLAATTVISYMMCRSWRSLRGTLLVLVISAVMLARAALSGYSGGRAATDTMYDTNDLAYVLVTVFPIAAGFALTARTRLKKLMYAAATGTLLMAALLTQSRGGLFGLVTAAMLLLLLPVRAPEATGSGGKVRRKRKLVTLVAGVCVAGLVWTQLPEAVRLRFSTVLDLGNDYNLDPHNDKSRGQIWSRALRATLSRPVGYGPNSFGMVDYRMGGRMMAPHNSLVETVVELGVLGLILFLRMYWLAWRKLGRMRQQLLRRPILSPESREQFVFARALQCALAGNVVAGFFLSMAWATILWLLFGLTMALIALAETSIEEHA
jgi:hypothetical protein